MTLFGVTFHLPAHITVTETRPRTWSGGGTGPGACTVTITDGGDTRVSVLLREFPRSVAEQGGEVAKNVEFTPPPSGFSVAVDQSWSRVMPGGWRQLHSTRTVVLNGKAVAVAATGSGENVLDCDTERLTQDVRVAEPGAAVGG